MPPPGFEPRSQPPQGYMLSKLYHGSNVSIYNEKLYKYLPSSNRGINMEKVKCTSCKVEVVNKPGSASFKCPNCGKADIIRCFHCRELGTRYACKSCSFVGPN